MTQEQTMTRGPIDCHAKHKALFERMRRCDFVSKRDIRAVHEFEALLDEFAALPIDYSYNVIQGLHRAGGRQFTQFLHGSDMAYVALWTTPAAIAFVLKIQRFAFILFNSYTRRYTITIKRDDAAARDADDLPGPIPLTRCEAPMPPRRRRRGGRGRRPPIKREMSPLTLPRPAEVKLNITMAEIEELTRPAPVVAKKNWGEMLSDSDADGAEMPELEADTPPQPELEADTPEAKK